MTPERWQRVEELFHAARARKPEEREAFLQDACADDPSLVGEVASVLRHAPASEDVSGTNAEDVPILHEGSVLGHYRVEARLGAGGMGEVYRGVDTRLNRSVAIKVSRRAFSSRFRREALVLSAFNHPHICTLYDVGTDFLVMELVDGETLAARLRKGPLPLADVFRLGAQIAGALAEAHAKDIIHRDLKPGNIMVTRNGAKVLDFGLAAVQDARITQTGHVIGTPAYLAPEQLEGRVAGPPTDIYALGMVLHEMASGHRPVVEDARTRLAELPPPLAYVVERCVAREPASRWQSAGEVRALLEWSAQAPKPEPATTRKWSRAAAIVTALAGVAVGVLIVLGVFAFGPGTSQPSPTRFDVNTPPTSDAFSFALSPDGRQLVFVADADGRPLLWVRTLDQVTAQPLVGTEGASYPFWSPDSFAVGFFADGKLKRRDVAGGPPQVLADAPGARGGTWNRDGDIVFAPDATVGLKRVAATGGTAVPLTRLAADHGSHRWPQFLPDGRRFLFFVGLGQARARGVYLGSLDAGEPTHVLAGETAAVFAPPGYLLRVLKGVLVAHRFDVKRGTVDRESRPVAQLLGTDDGTFHSAFSVSETGVLAHRPGAGTKRQLVWTDGAGRTLGTLGPIDDGVPSAPDLSHDGQRLALARAPEGTGDIWLIDVARNVASRMTFDPGVDAYPVWSPHGDRLVFSSGRNGRMDLFERGSNDVTEERPLIATGEDKVPQDWSPDGQVLLYTVQNPKTGSDLWAAPVDKARGTSADAGSSTGQAFPVAQSGFDEGQGRFSPDGRWVVYASNETGRHEVYVQSFPDLSRKLQVSTGGGIYPRWRPDGRELFYLAPDMRLMAVPIQITSSPAIVNPGAPRALFPTRLATTGPYVFTAGIFAKAQYAVAPDGRFLMNVIGDAVASPITLVLNWTSGLRN